MGVETTNHFILYQNHRHTVTVQLFELVLTFGGIIDIVFIIRDVIGLEELACPGAIFTPGCAIENHFLRMQGGKVGGGCDQGMDHSPTQHRDQYQNGENGFLHRLMIVQYGVVLRGIVFRGIVLKVLLTVSVDDHGRPSAPA